MRKQYFLNYLKALSKSSSNKKKILQSSRYYSIKKLNNIFKLKQKNYNLVCVLHKFISCDLYIRKQNKFNPNIIN